NVAFAVPNAGGGLAYPNNEAWIRNTVIPNAHANGVKVMVSVGGWMSDSPGAGTYNSAISSGNRGTMVNSIVNLVNGWGVDGADIDYEYPSGAATTDYGYFINDLDNALGSKLLTAAVAAFGGNADGVPSSAFGHFDFVNLMAYDIRDPNHSDYQDAVNS